MRSHRNNDGSLAPVVLRGALPRHLLDDQAIGVFGGLADAATLLDVLGAVARTAARGVDVAGHALPAVHVVALAALVGVDAATGARADVGLGDDADGLLPVRFGGQGGNRTARHQGQQCTTEELHGHTSLRVGCR